MRYYACEEEVLKAKLEDAVEALKIVVLNLQDEVDDLTDANNKMKTFIDTYCLWSGLCIGCGEIKHPHFVCYHCGCDDSSEEDFYHWFRNELVRQQQERADEQTEKTSSD